MLPSTRSIFHLGEEGEASTGLPTITTSRGGAPESLVGLRILIQHHRRGSNIVTKPAMIKSGSAGTSNSVEYSGFLKACFLCNKELSLQKDVYMYRGDQGFCSVECRCRQILQDERRELEASARERAGMLRHRRAGSAVRESDRRRRISVAA